MYNHIKLLGFNTCTKGLISPSKRADIYFIIIVIFMVCRNKLKQV